MKLDGNRLMQLAYRSLTLYDLCFFRVRCYGPGIEPTGPIVDAPANFTVETFSAGKGEKL